MEQRALEPLTTLAQTRIRPNFDSGGLYISLVSTTAEKTTNTRYQITFPTRIIVCGTLGTGFQLNCTFNDEWLAKMSSAMIFQIKFGPYFTTLKGFTSFLKLYSVYLVKLFILRPRQCESSRETKTSACLLDSLSKVLCRAKDLRNVSVRKINNF